MVEPADFWSHHDATRADSLDAAGLGCVFAERQVSTGAVVIRQVGSKHVPKVSLVDDNHMVEALATDRTDHAFDVGILPRRTWCRAEGRETERVDGAVERRIEGRVAVVEEISRGRVVRRRSREAAGGPTRRWDGASR